MEPLAALVFNHRSIAAAVTLTVLTVFMVGVKLWGKASKPHDLQDDSADSVPRINYSIFLSHSGQQKPFVEKLCNALQSINYTAFFDKHSLPKASPFPPHIKRAACGCKLGVVVLSDGFLSSKWPMLELEMLVMKRGPNPRVLPLFYELSPSDVRSRRMATNMDEEGSQTYKTMEAGCKNP